MSETKFSQEQLQEFEKRIDTVYIERSMTFTNINSTKIFSLTDKIGYSISIPHNLTLEQTEELLDKKIHERLKKKMNSIFKPKENEE